MKLVALLLGLSILPAFGAEQHAPLSALETHNLTAALAQAKRGEVTIICAGDWCRDLATNVSALFHAAKWKVHDENHGGMGIDGLKGIRLDVQGMDGKSVSELLKRSTNRKIDFIEGGATQRPMIFLVIGTP